MLTTSADHLPDTALLAVSHGLSLRGRLVLLVLVSIVPLLGFFLGRQYLEYRENVEATGQRILTVASSISLLIDDELQAQIAALETLAVSRFLQDGDLGAFRLRTEALLARQFPGANIVLLKENGQQIMNTLLPRGAPLPVRPNMETTRQVFATGDPVVSSLYEGTVGRRLEVAIDVPVKGPDGTVAYVLSMNPSLEKFTDISRLRLPLSWRFAVFDRHAVTIAHIPNEGRFVGQKASPQLLSQLTADRDGIVENMSREGIPLLSAFSHSERFGWAVAVGVPKAELTGPALSTALHIVAVEGTLLLLSLVLALYAARRIAGPIDSLRRLAVADRVGSLNLSATGLRETDEVAKALRSAEENRQETLAALKRSEEQLKRGQRLAHVGSTFRDLQTGEASWSDEAYRIFGVDRETWVPTTENFVAMLHPDDRAKVLSTLNPAAPLEIAQAPFECRITRPDGSVRTIHRENEIVTDDAGNPRYLAGTIHDITEQRRTEELLRQAQKMEAIGNLTGGIAHDFNNLLGVIIGNLDLAAPLVADNDEVTELVQEAIDAADSGAELTDRLLSFARRQPLRPERIAANELISSLVGLLRRMLGENIEITLDLADGLWSLAADPAQLEASLINLITNARDAMPSGGKLSIATANRHLDAAYVAGHADATPGDYVAIAVTDTGTGMPAEITEHIFEPFYTTKEPGKGTGLGLSMVFGFIKQSGGHISVYSERGVGTTFRLYLPRAAPDLPQVVEANPIAMPHGNGETVLAVEDDPRLRRVVMRQLRELGYRPVEADGPVAALGVFAREKVDLLFTDIVMPGPVNGIALARQALERWPKLKVVLTSGFPGTRLEDEPGPFSSAVRLLTKPYHTEDLARVLREVLDGNEPSRRAR
jgi:PAS domain S-box-containing protein